MLKKQADISRVSLLKAKSKIKDYDTVSWFIGINFWIPFQIFICRLTDRYGHEDERKDKEGKIKYHNSYLWALNPSYENKRRL